MRILFIGETWQGSSARSLRDALALLPQVKISDIGEDHYLPRHRYLLLRGANRLLRPLQRRDLEKAVLDAIDGDRPDAVMVFKGAGISAGLLQRIGGAAIPTINVFPDYSPHAYGRQLREAIGVYDLVISAKPFHPRLWESLYGYSNACVCVPHGYDPSVHYWPEPASGFLWDVALCSTWRPEYHRLMVSFAEALGEINVSVAIAGSGWSAHRSLFPSHWRFFGSRSGRAYGEFLRAAKIVIAPVNREVVICGETQPGDEDTTRTYELAAANCFFVHQRTDYVATVYDEHEEVPLWGDATELASLVRRWLPDESGRLLMAARAHVRAVPAYSIPQRAVSVLHHVEGLISARSASRADA